MPFVFSVLKLSFSQTLWTHLSFLEAIHPSILQLYFHTFRNAKQAAHVLLGPEAAGDRLQGRRGPVHRRQVHKQVSYLHGYIYFRIMLFFHQQLSI